MFTSYSHYLTFTSHSHQIKSHYIHIQLHITSHSHHTTSHYIHIIFTSHCVHISFTSHHITLHSHYTHITLHSHHIHITSLHLHPTSQSGQLGDVSLLITLQDTGNKRKGSHLLNSYVHSFGKFE